MLQTENRRSKIEDRKTEFARSSIFDPRSSNPTAFTLVELLVVILIIGVLMGILIPVVGVIRRKAQAAASLAQLNAIRGAIEAYQGTYNAYPGPIPDIHMFTVDPGTPPLPNGIAAAGTGARMTQSENLTLALFGGLSDQNGQITFNPTDIGIGPRNLSMGNPGQHPAFYTNSRELSKGFIKDSVEITGSQGFDTNIPEFIDKFADPMPVLYLRARKGARGVMSDMKNYNAQNPSDFYQYDVRQYYAYVADLSSDPPTTGQIICAKKQGPFYDLASGDPRQGIGDPAYGGKGDPLINRKDGVNYAIAYFRNPALSSADPAMTNETGSPRNKDEFILISAGPDRLFGTADDLTTFGSVVP